MQTETIHAIILGIIQGLTEFLPVSSSGHLEIAKYVLGGQQLPEESLMMTVTLHFATALATVLVFRKEIGRIIRGLFQFRNNGETAFSLKIILSMIPAALVGLLLKEQIEQLFNRQIVLVGASLMVTGFLLFWANRSRDTQGTVTYSNAFAVGIAQAIAILPGISRSGATISSGLLLGIEREQATRFSFLMVVPLIFGKMAKDILDGGVAMETDAVSSLLPGFIFAFITGYLACVWMIRLVKNSKLSYFAWYCLAVGLAAVLYGFANHLY